MGHADANAARAARNEVRGDNSVTWLDGREYKLKPELYFDAIDAWAVNDRDAFVRAVLTDPAEADDFLKPDFGWPDLYLVWHLVLTGKPPEPDAEQDVGESSASPPSSKTGGRRSRPTSNASTTKT